MPGGIPRRRPLRAWPSHFQDVFVLCLSWQPRCTLLSSTTPEVRNFLMWKAGLAQGHLAPAAPRRQRRRMTAGAQLLAVAALLTATLAPSTTRSPSQVVIVGRWGPLSCDPLVDHISALECKTCSDTRRRRN